MTPQPLQQSMVHAKLRLMRELLDDLEMVGDVSAERLLADRLTLRAVERVLTQLVDLGVSVNAHIVTAVAGQAPSTYRSSFDDVATHGVLPAGLATRLKPSVGMRNILVHDYAAIDLAMVAAAVPLARQDYDRYVRSVARWVVENTEA